MTNSTTLELVISAKDEATAKLEGLQGTLQGMSGTLKTVGAVGATVFAGISALAIKSIADYADAEKSALALKHAVLDVTHATQEQYQATSDLADALEKKGVLDGDNIKMGLAQLSTFGLSNDAVRKLGGSLSDLAVNQFGVSASGEQLSDSANMIAKALNGQFGVLEKSGIRFTDAQKNMIKFGTEMQKVDAINQGFAQNLKYTNEVALQGIDGQVAKTKVQMGNLSEAIGSALEPALLALLTAITPVIEKFVAFATAHPKLIAGILAIVAGLAGLVAVLATVAIGIATVTLVASPWLLIIGAIILAVGALVFAGVELYKNWDNIKELLKILWADLKVYFKSGVDAIIGYFQPLISLVEQVMARAQQVASFVGNVISGASSMVSSAYSTVSNAVTGKRATGGTVAGGSSYLVGENGAEIFTPSSIGNITPNNRISGGANNIIINITGTFLSDDAGRRVGDMIVQRFKQMSRVGV